MATRAENIATILACAGLNETLDDVVSDAVTDNLGYEAFTDAALELMAAAYRRPVEAEGLRAGSDDRPGPAIPAQARHLS